MKNRKRHTGIIVALSVFAAIIAAGTVTVGVYSRFGGFGTGECADVNEFSKYATELSELTVPDNTQIFALGEATHGNREFQQLRLDVLRILVEKYGVRAFALEGDFGGCEAVNRYVHGGDGTAAEALSAVGFAIYRTEETEQLVGWMREYNESAPSGGDLRFYGFDMQQRAYSYRCLLEIMQKNGIDTEEYEKMWNSEAGTNSEGCSAEQRAAILCSVKEQLPPNEVQAVHFADVLLQNIELGKYANDSAELNEHRDRMMAENVMWILEQERARGNKCIMISGHNNHIMRCENGGVSGLGALLSEKLSNGYFAVGTDFRRSVCNLPKPYTGKRITHTFYSRDPLANASKKCGFDVCFLDFSKVPSDSALTEYLENNISMGSLGEAYSVLMNFVSRSYRVSRAPRESFDALIFVSSATPIEIKTATNK